MEEFLLQYGLFLAKSITVFILLIFIIVMAASSKKKDKDEDDSGKIVIKKLNDEVEKFEKVIANAALDDLEREKNDKRKKKEKKAEVKALKKDLKADNDIPHKPNCYVLRFDGDRDASETANLSKEISAILTNLKEKDEVIIALESPGGSPHGYGYGASQILRLKDKGATVTICVDKVAASGGYMMACVGDKILAAPFAIVGSIGVVAQMLNVNKVLTKHDVEVEHHTAGEYKRTLTFLGENTDKGREKFKETLEDMHVLFKDHVQHYRPDLKMEEVGTGEFWFGTQALQKGLVDEISTSDAYIMSKMSDNNVFSVKYKPKKKVSDKLSGLLSSSVGRTYDTVLDKLNERRFY